MYEFETLPLSALKITGDNPRISGAFKDLADDIRQNGLINPITVRKQNGAYEVVAGHRRLAAVKSLKWEAVPCHVVDPESDTATAIMRLKENVARKELSTYEQAHALMRIQKLGKLNLVDLAKSTGYSKSAVAKYSMLTSEPGRLAPEIEDEWRKGNALLSVPTLCDKIYNAGDHNAQMKSWEALKKAARTGPEPSAADRASGSVEDADDSAENPKNLPKPIGAKRLEKLVAMIETLSPDDGLVAVHDQAVIAGTIRWVLGQTRDIRYAGETFMSDPIKAYDALHTESDKERKRAAAAKRTAKKERERAEAEAARLQSKLDDAKRRAESFAEQESAEAEAAEENAA